MGVDGVYRSCRYEAHSAGAESFLSQESGFPPRVFFTEGRIFVRQYMFLVHLSWPPNGAFGSGSDAEAIAPCHLLARCVLF